MNKKNIDKEDPIKKLFKVDNLPESVKKNVLDKDGNLNEFSKRFVFFFIALNRAFESHFYDIIIECKPDETWDILNNPNPFINQVCSSFMEEYNKSIMGDLSDKEKIDVDAIIPRYLVPLVHKKYVLTHILTLPKTIMELKEEEQIGYYRTFSGDTYSDDETVIQKLTDVVKLFHKEINKCHNSIQDEWQDKTLDAYNKNIISKDLMGFVMAEINKRKTKIDE